MVDKKYNHESFFEQPPQSYWLASTEETDYPALNSDININVAIVGGGMVGILTAKLLKEAGLDVAVIEADRIIQGTTGHTTAKITSQHGLIYNKIKTQMGKEKATQYADANETAIHMIAGIVKEKNIDCDFSWQSAYVYTQSDKYVKNIVDEAKTAASLGIKSTYLDEIPLPFPVKAAVRFDHQAQFHPRKLLLALAREIPGGGCHIFEQTEAVDIEGTGPYSVVTKKGNRVNAPIVIIASHFPFYDKRGFYFARIYPEKSYALTITAKEKFPGGMYINAEQPTRSLRSQSYENGELIIVAGEHHKTGQGESTSHHYERLWNFANQIFTVENSPYHWSTQDCMTMDGIPYVGPLTNFKDNLYVATGFGKWGMTNSAVSAMLLKDLIIKGDSTWAPVYTPTRLTLSASAKNFVIENLNVAGKLIGGKLEWLQNDVSIKPGEGKIVNVNGHRTGAYRDEKGELHLVDTTCTHMGCEVEWNSAERSWDCPCHGSRFSVDGTVIEGPALKSLVKFK